MKILMKATEFRLHNRISITEKARKELWECEMDVQPLSTGFITSIDVDECRVLLDSQEYEMYYEDLEPIPLDEEWLLKFGFYRSIENAGNLECYKKGSITVAKWIDNKWQVWIDSKDLRKSPQYLHQLQNLFFALCGEELTIKKDAPNNL